MRAPHSPGAVLNRVLLAALLAILLAACGSGGGGGSTASTGSTGTSVTATQPVAMDTVINGSVGDGPVTGATIEAWSSSGQLLGSMTSDSTASFKSTLKVKGKDYPLLLKVRGGVDLVTGSAPDFQMLSIMEKPSVKQVNITPFSTLVVLAAQRMPGGLNSANLATALDYVTGRLGFGLDLRLLDDPITGQVTEANVANLVKSSEAFGEMIRRTRDLVTGTGRHISGDDVLRTLAADLRDGYVDGLGASGVDATISAVANVVSGQVLVEALSNDLKVGGVIATGVIDQAIRTTRPRTSGSQLTGGVRVTAGMLQQAQGALAAVQVLDSSAQIQAVAAGIESVSVDALPGEVALVLPADASTSLNNALSLAVTAQPKTLTAVNLAVYSSSDSSGSTNNTNSSPVLTGTPATSVVANNGYIFQPGATDADGDTLTFSITNRPGWAAFNTATGRLYGTPKDTDAGTYGNIVLSASDGSAITSMPAFSIRVDAATGTTGSFTVNWTAPVAHADGTPLSPGEIDGYNIYYGDSPGVYDRNVNIADGQALSATVRNVTSDDYHVVMTTYDINGRESGYSAEIIKHAN